MRFNMPFELGLACALKLTSPTDYDIFVLDGRAFRTDRTLSDYKGRDPLIHNGTSDGMIACLLDMFTPAVTQTPASFRGALKELRTSALQLKTDMRVTSMFRPAMFRLLLGLASPIAEKRGFIPPRAR